MPPKGADDSGQPCGVSVWFERQNRRLSTFDSPAEDGCGTPNLVSTILHTTFDMARVRLKPELAAITKLSEAKPIPGVM